MRRLSFSRLSLAGVPYYSVGYCRRFATVYPQPEISAPSTGGGPCVACTGRRAALPSSRAAFPGFVPSFRVSMSRFRAAVPPCRVPVIPRRASVLLLRAPVLPCIFVIPSFRAVFTAFMLYSYHVPGHEHLKSPSPPHRHLKQTFSPQYRCRLQVLLRMVPVICNRPLSVHAGSG